MPTQEGGLQRQGKGEKTAWSWLQFFLQAMNIPTRFLSLHKLAIGNTGT